MTEFILLLGHINKRVLSYHDQVEYKWSTFFGVKSVKVAFLNLLGVEHLSVCSQHILSNCRHNLPRLTFPA